MVVKLLFLSGVFILFYSYFGYGLLLWSIQAIRNLFFKKRIYHSFSDAPCVTLMVAAYNEQDFIEKKIKNTLDLDYPSEKIEFIFITDGSTDSTREIVSAYPRLTLLHTPERQGKIAAITRAMSYVKTPYVIFSDANTLLNKNSVRNIVRHYQDPEVGGVAGEKKILSISHDVLNSAGEGLYWKYESWLKKLDSSFYTVVGAAGELFSIRTDLYQHPGSNIILDDFVISLQICQKGYRIVYEPDAYALETPSSSIKEEQKRKIRISAGAFQSIFILLPLLNFFKYPALSFQYISHRILRWTLCPLLLPIVYSLNVVLVFQSDSFLFLGLLICQSIFYFLSFAGWFLYQKQIRINFLYAPYYFVFINISLCLGFVRHLRGNQSVLWEKAQRNAYSPNMKPVR